MWCNFDGLRGNLCRAAYIRWHQKLYEFLPEAIAADIAPPGRGSHQRSSEESARDNASVKLEHVEQSTPSKSSTSLSIQITTGSRDDATAAISGSLVQAASTSSLPSRGGEQAGASTSSLPSRGGEQAGASTSSLPSRGGERAGASTSSMLSRGGEKASAAASSSPGQAASTSSRRSRGGERTSAAAAGSLDREFLDVFGSSEKGA